MALQIRLMIKIKLIFHYAQLPIQYNSIFYGSKNDIYSHGGWKPGKEGPERGECNWFTTKGSCELYPRDSNDPHPFDENSF